VFPDAGGTSVEFLQAVLSLHLAPPFDLAPFVNSGTRMITWSHSGPLDGGILCLKAIHVSWMEVVGLPQTPLALLPFLPGQFDDLYVKVRIKHVL